MEQDFYPLKIIKFKIKLKNLRLTSTTTQKQSLNGNSSSSGYSSACSDRSSPGPCVFNFDTTNNDLNFESNSNKVQNFYENMNLFAKPHSQQQSLWQY